MLTIKKMKASDKKAWILALRSGEYKQGTGGLVGRNGYCCLGVAQCVLGKRPPSMRSRLLRPGRFGLTNSIQYALALANDGMATVMEFKKFGLPSPVPRGKRRASFNDIAKWVGKYL